MDLKKNLVLFALYFITAKFGLMIDPVSGLAALVWAPTGIAIAATVLYGRTMLPAIALGAIVMGLSSGTSLLVAVAIGLGNAIEALLAAYLLRRVGFDKSLERPKDIVALIGLAAVLSTCVSATIGISSLLVGNVITQKQALSAFTTWWMGDAMGALIVTPLILVWSKKLTFT